MLSEPKVLIIEADPQLGRELQAVLKFINCTPVLVGDPATLERRHRKWQ